MTEAATETKTEQKPDEESLVQKIRETVSEALGSLLDSGDAVIDDTSGQKPETKTEQKPAGPREEESRMESLVGEAVKTLTEKIEKFGGEKPEEKKTEQRQPEVIPGPVGFAAKVRKSLWG